MQPPISGASAQPSDPAPVSPWIDHLGRVSYIRGHISLFAAGSVILLALDLLSGDGGVWADTAILLWAVLLVVHVILAVIARLLRELLSEDEAPARPVAEATWRLPGSWGHPPRTGEGAPPSPPSPEAPADATRAPSAPVVPGTSGSSERVSWAEATRAAWLARRHRKPEQDVANEPQPATNDAPKNDNDPNDFTPLKLD